ncbi:hypothetical protein QBC47DRAFT_119169 [Echria macrotheca]|uniref:Zn(2)-C6 fungal-type domain-containing protein n=1 Tax=Echria macrotheca TaxID=438768 RepID=A0AAJ0B3K3_9PEZI|nr:hypothetical protein QBC47DRAFT_119169 [Echria macrotheca]
MYTPVYKSPSMDQGQPDPKRPRLSTTGSPWSAGGAHHGVSLLHPTPSPTNPQLPHHPPASAPYPPPQPSPQHPYSRPGGPGDPHHPPPPPPPPPPSAPQHHPAHHAPPPPQQPPPPGSGSAPGPHSHPHHPPPPPPPPPHAQHNPSDDRRHHEPERFPPMQEHRQPPHSPAHAAFPGYPPRDPSVKPDPGEDTLPQLRRPLSTGTGPEVMTPGTPHSALPPQGYPDDKRHLPYDAPPPPPMYHRQPSYPPQTPLPHPQSYDYPPSYGPQHAELPYPIQITSAAGKRKAQRASQACDSCRQLKAKCDELKPCKSCKEKKVECKYREAVPKQQDKVASDILEAIMALRSEFNMFNQRMTRMEHAMARGATTLEMQREMMRHDDDRPGSVDSPPPQGEEAYSSSPGDTATGVQAPIGSLEARTVARNMEDLDETEGPGPTVRPGVPTIPPNHTTLAALLLKWPSIESLVRRYLDAENVKFVEEFPIRQEQRRGLLRIWGRGEGLDSSRVDGDALHDVGMMEVQDDYSDSGAPSPADCWGGISGSPGPVDGRSIVGVQSLDFSDAIVWKYVKAYKEHIQNMHPLIIPVELDAMVKLFLDSLQQNKDGGKPGVARFVQTLPGGQGETGSKRKRSPVPDSDGGPVLQLPKPPKPTFQRSINNALVLLVLALGKICLVRDRKIPDVVPVSEPTYGSPLVRNGHPASPIQGSPPSYSSHSHSSGLPSPKEVDRSSASRRASFQGAGGPQPKTTASLKRNLDVIPGLDYFAYATDILGGQLAGTSLRHIHAYILAGLYHGQLGRVMESYAYIKEAGWALQIRIRPRLDRFKQLHETMPSQLNAVTEKSDNGLVFAFWTCLQLESDIIAELPLPQSHILAYEEIMPYPNIPLAREQGFEHRVLESYLAQLYLRKSLNQIHQTLYNPEDVQSLKYQAGTPTGNIIEWIQSSLDMRFVPAEFKFKHNDPPATDILAARLRAKYWGAQVITYRPFIRQILGHNHKKLSMRSPADFNADGSGQSGMQDVSMDTEITDDMVENAVKGIRALIESTRAFHGLEDKRFVITNVFGTAHAQWGNLLTLAAAFKDPTLSPYIDEGILRDLFIKTIAFFKIISQPTSALAIDMRILEGVEREFWRKPVGGGDGMDHPNSSFSSTTSSGPPLPPINSMSRPGLLSSAPPPPVPMTGMQAPPGGHGHIDGMITTLPPMQRHP